MGCCPDLISLQGFKSCILIDILVLRRNRYRADCFLSPSSAFISLLHSTVQMIKHLRRQPALSNCPSSEEVLLSDAHEVCDAAAAASQETILLENDRRTYLPLLFASATASFLFPPHFCSSRPQATSLEGSS